MRGKEICMWILAMIRRITPAYAGKSYDILHARACIRDHPRLCGEKAMTKSHLVTSCGITPAYAGKRPRVQM